MRGQPRPAALPVANRISVSEVEVSLSTVMALKVVSTLAASMACSAAAEIGASVKMKESIVAMSGAIMPAPLATPAMLTVTPAISTAAPAPLGKVSVVMIARPVSIHSPGVARAAQSSRTPSNFEASSGSPMTPVEAMTISPGLQPMARAAMSAVFATAAAPSRPVKALALPELTTRPRTVRPFRASRHQSTGADGHLDFVKTPAASVPSSRTASITSRRPL